MTSSRFDFLHNFPNLPPSISEHAEKVESLLQDGHIDMTATALRRAMEAIAKVYWQKMGLPELTGRK